MSTSRFFGGDSRGDPAGNGLPGRTRLGRMGRISVRIRRYSRLMSERVLISIEDDDVDVGVVVVPLALCVWAWLVGRADSFSC